MGVSNKAKPRGLLAILIYFWFMARTLFSIILFYKSMPHMAEAAVVLKLLWVLTWLCFAGFAFMSFAAFYKLKDSYHPSSVSFAIKALWISGPVAQAIIGGLMVTIEAVSDTGLAEKQMADTVGRTICSILFAAAWTVYLKYSKQVHALYHNTRNEDSIST